MKNVQASILCKLWKPKPHLVPIINMKIEAFGKMREWKLQLAKNIISINNVLTCQTHMYLACGRDFDPMDIMSH